MSYLATRNGWYYYSRHVPRNLKNYDSRSKIRISMNTKCPKTALKMAVSLNDDIEQYWQNLIKTQSFHNKQNFKNLVKTSKLLGFQYIPSMKLAQADIKEIVTRILFSEKAMNNTLVTNAVLGKEKPQSRLISQALERFWDYSKPTLMKKNKQECRKWKNPRKKAVTNFIKIVEDKNILEITNLDLLKLRDWWLMRVQNDAIKASTVNKDFTHLKGILKTVSAHEQLNIDIDAIFKNIYLPEDNKGTRRPFDNRFISQELLCSERLKGIEEEAKYILYACAETGARPKELLNLDGANDIILDAPIPYIHIRSRKGYALKTKVSDRKIPLIGYALKAFKKYPHGFKYYQGKSDLFSGYINNFLLEKKLRPTLNHTLYSLRHSFQDRLTEQEIPDRIQCQLMGHSFKAKGRTVYGSGASLERLKDVMGRVSLAKNAS